MKIVKKIKEYGIRKSIGIIYQHYVVPMINKVVHYICWVFPANEKLIVMESEGDLSDNAYALYDYMMKNGYLKNYKVVWLVDDIEFARKKGKSESFENTKFSIKVPVNIQPKRSFYLATCKWYIYDHCNLLNCKKRKEQKIVYLGHGAGFKALKGADTCSADEFYITSPLFAEPLSRTFNCSTSIMKDLGYPRLDYFFKGNNVNQEEFKKKYNMNNFKKTILWMPTFRRSHRNKLDEKYFVSETGLPILYKRNDIYQLNERLKAANLLCFFKIHHLQAELDVFKNTYSNIIILNDEMINGFGIQLYEFIKLTDCLITDYSSISTDYMLLNKPIIYTMDDYDEYKKSRGFSIDDPSKYYIGYHVVNKRDLFDAIEECSQGLDRYREARNDILPLLHTHIDGNASRRILDHVGIIK